MWNRHWPSEILHDSQNFYCKEGIVWQNHIHNHSNRENKKCFLILWEYLAIFFAVSQYLHSPERFWDRFRFWWVTFTLHFNHRYDLIFRDMSLVSLFLMCRLTIAKFHFHRKLLRKIGGVLPFLSRWIVSIIFFKEVFCPLIKQFIFFSCFYLYSLLYKIDHSR